MEFVVKVLGRIAYFFIERMCVCRDQRSVFPIGISNLNNKKVCDMIFFSNLEKRKIKSNYYNFSNLEK